MTMMTNESIPEPSFDEQLSALADLSQPLQRARLKALSDIEPANLRKLTGLWPSIPGERRVAIVAALDELSEDTVEFDFQPVFRFLLDDGEAAVRAAAVDGLWEDERISTMDRLIALLSDPAGDVRVAAALGLGRFAYRAELGEMPAADGARVLNALLGVVADPEQPLDVRRRAVEGLGYFANSNEAQAEVGRAYAHPEQLVRESAVAAMGRSMRATWHPYIERELKSVSPAMRYEAARAVGELGEDGQPMLPSLVPLVEDEDSEIAMAAMWALGQVGGPHAKRVLQRLARSQDPARKQAALDALEELALGEV
jgi:HEAT repeat protein